MRPLFHPTLEDITVEGILYALSDPVRVAIFASVATSGCSQSCSQLQNLSEMPVPKSTLSRHFTVLREAGLIYSERKGVEMQNRSRCAEIEQRFPGLIASIIRAHNIQLEEKKQNTLEPNEPTSSTISSGYPPHVE